MNKELEELRETVDKLHEWCKRADEKSKCVCREDGAVMIVELPMHLWEELFTLAGWENQDSPQQMGWVGFDGRP